ncbi:hypothetical protein, partial [Bacteroides thetaiotaomicron]|uniref:hypothetical protein n=1 Tax=Bacteroides thetaiotaomicron TaxID=818 RepID=UPI0019553BA3
SYNKRSCQLKPVHIIPRRKRQFPLKGTVVSIKRNARSLTGKRQFPLKEMTGNYKRLIYNHIEYYR